MTAGDDHLLRNVTREVLAELLPGLLEEALTTPAAANGNGHRPPAHQAGRHQFPRGVTNDGERFAGVLHRPQERLYFRLRAHSVGVDGAAGEQDCIEILRAGVLDGAIDFDLYGLVDVVANCLDFPALERDDGDNGPGVLERFDRLH